MLGQAANDTEKTVNLTELGAFFQTNVPHVLTYWNLKPLISHLSHVEN